MFCLSALFNSGTCRVEAACTSLPDDFFLSPSPRAILARTVWNFEAVAPRARARTEGLDTSLFLTVHAQLTTVPEYTGFVHVVLWDSSIIEDHVRTADLRFPQAKPFQDSRHSEKFLP